MTYFSRQMGHETQLSQIGCAGVSSFKKYTNTHMLFLLSIHLACLPTPLTRHRSGIYCVLFWSERFIQNHRAFA